MPNWQIKTGPEVASFWLLCENSDELVYSQATLMKTLDLSTSWIQG